LKETRSHFRQILRWLLAGVVGLSVGFAVYPHLVRLGGFQHVWLWAGSVAFVLLSFCGTAEAPQFTWAMRLGLVGCALGDFLGPRNFHLGVVMFLLAHLAFSAAFLIHGVAWRRLLARAPIVVGASLLVVVVWLWPHVPENDRGLVAGYTTVISVMAILAGGLSPSPARGLLWVGAWVFYLSDIFVARWRFVDSSPSNGLACYSLYYTACVLLAWGATAIDERKSQRGQTLFR